MYSQKLTKFYYSGNYVYNNPLFLSNMGNLCRGQYFIPVIYKIDKMKFINCGIKKNNNFTGYLPKIPEEAITHPAK